MNSVIQSLSLVRNGALQSSSMNIDQFVQSLSAAEQEIFLTAFDEANKSGIEFRILWNDPSNITDIRVIIRQIKIINGVIFNSKQLYDMAKELFAPYKVKIKAEIFKLDLSAFTIEWVQYKIKELGIDRNDITQHLGIDKAQLNLLFNKSHRLTRIEKAAFYYYFLVYEQNREFSKQQGELG